MRPVDQETKPVRRAFNPLFRVIVTIVSRLHPTPPASLDTVGPLPEQVLQVSTRYGRLRAVVVVPPERADRPADALLPVVVQLHGGGFITRYPEQDRFIARRLAASLDAVVVLPDYDTAPTTQYPVAEHEAYDVVRWIRDSGPERGWDPDRLLLSGVSAGSKLAINICQQLHAAGEPRPIAVSLVVPFTDASRADRTSSYRKAVISPFIQRSVLWSYFPDPGTRRDPLCSPRFDADLPSMMPPTIVQTAALDTLCPEGEELARTLQAGGVEVVHRRYPDADHMFYSHEPADRVHELLDQVTGFFAARLA